MRIKVFAIEKEMFRDDAVSRIYFAPRYEKDPGYIVVAKDFAKEILEHWTRTVVFSGGEVLNQNMNELVKMATLLRFRYKKKVVVETEATRFPQLLFLNCNKFILHPKREKFKQDRFERYLSLYNIHLDSPRIYKNGYAFINKQHDLCKNLEIIYDITSKADLDFYMQLENKYDFDSRRIPRFLKYITHREFTEKDLAEAMDIYLDDLYKRKYLQLNKI
jgi:replicative superfamily II helicase